MFAAVSGLPCFGGAWIAKGCTPTRLCLLVQLKVFGFSKGWRQVVASSEGQYLRSLPYCCSQGPVLALDRRQCCS